MEEYRERMLFDDTKQMLYSGFTDFLTGDELKFIDRQADRLFLDFVRGVPGLDMDYSNAMKTGLLHELRHVWQHLNEPWKSLFGDGINTMTDVDTELDAFENQIPLEKILGIESTFGAIFRSIEERAKQANNPVRRATIRYWKAEEIKKKYEETNRYRIRSRSEYEKEDPE